ncbi:MAG: Nitroreductase family protein [Methanosaeta sp. PtaU1.Bin112]|nr:MAG: Nitroreductase family protein [Methanosaeta sp. PtaU1.Bin112]
MSEDYDQVIAYHLRTKHRPRSMAPGPTGLDWSTQPDPFRRYEGAAEIPLSREGFHSQESGIEGTAEYITEYRTDCTKGPSPLNLMSLSQLFFESLAISGQKSLARARWFLRVNPSSGNLHPTEAYLIAGPFDASYPALSPGLYHYSPKIHALEKIAGMEESSWQALGLARGTLLLALTSIYWRQSWKYGERGFRYSMLDLGHAMAAVAVAARCLGWQAQLEDDLGTDDLTALLGLKDLIQHSGNDLEDEHAGLLMTIRTDGSKNRLRLHLSNLSKLKFQREPVRANVLSSGHVPWDWIELASEASKKQAADNICSAICSAIRSDSSSLPGAPEARNDSSCDPHTDPVARYGQVLRKRRSAQVMDGKSSMPKHSFFAILQDAMPRSSPFFLLPNRPSVHPIIFAHRVDDLEKGLYLWLRDDRRKEELKEAMREDFLWERPSRTPDDIKLYLLAQGDSRLAAKETSCRQNIASDGCFAAAMLAQFEEPLKEYGPWYYRRLFWECGAIGQAFYLTAEAEGFQGCGIGCFFDDMVHTMLGLSGLKYQDLYHFTVGKAIADPRLIDLPAYERPPKKDQKNEMD